MTGTTAGRTVTALARETFRFRPEENRWPNYSPTAA